MKLIKVFEYSRSRSFDDDLILQGKASGERSQDQWSSVFFWGGGRGCCPESTQKLNREVDFCCCFWRSPGSNLRPLVYKASDLTTAPQRLPFIYFLDTIED